jgi:hypothetical protein
VSSMGFGGAGHDTATGAADPEAAAELGAAADAEAEAEGGADVAAVALGTVATGEGAAEVPQPTTMMTVPITSPSRSVDRSCI